MAKKTVVDEKEIRTTFNCWMVEALSYEICNTTIFALEDKKFFPCLLHYTAMWKPLIEMAPVTRNNKTVYNWFILSTLLLKLFEDDISANNILLNEIAMQGNLYKIKNEIVDDVLKVLHTLNTLHYFNKQNIRKARTYIQQHDVFYEEEFTQLLNEPSNTPPSMLDRANIARHIIPYIHAMVKELGKPLPYRMISMVNKNRKDIAEKRDFIRSAFQKQRFQTNSVHSTTDYCHPTITKTNINDHGSSDKNGSSNDSNVDLHLPSISHLKQKVMASDEELPTTLLPISKVHEPAFCSKQSSCCNEDSVRKNSSLSPKECVNVNGSTEGDGLSCSRDIQPNTDMVNSLINERAKTKEKEVLPKRSSIENKEVRLKKEKEERKDPHQVKEILKQYNRVETGNKSKYFLRTTNGSILLSPSECSHENLENNEQSVDVFENCKAKETNAVDSIESTSAIPKKLSVNNKFISIPHKNYGDSITKFKTRMRRVALEASAGDSDVFVPPAEITPHHSPLKYTKGRFNNTSKIQTASKSPRIKTGSSILEIANDDDTVNAVASNVNQVPFVSTTKKRKRGGMFGNNSDNSGESVLWSSDEETHSLRKRGNNNENKRPAKKKVLFTSGEEIDMVSGIKKYGVGSWSKILKSYDFHPSRTSVSLKDKYRTMKRQGLF